MKMCNLKFILYFSTKAYVVGAQNNHLNETVLFSTQNIYIFKLIDKTIIIHNIMLKIYDYLDLCI